VNYFLLKTEPTDYSIDDLRRDKKTSWGGVRNFQARNIVRDEIKKGDFCIIYHSSCVIPAAVGLGEIVKAPYPDLMQFDSSSKYFDPTSKKDDPRWFAVEVKFKEKFLAPLPLEKMRTIKELSDMRLLARGNRLSFMSLSKMHFEIIKKLSS